jgi:hypothetical protein
MNYYEDQTVKVIEEDRKNLEQTPNGGEAFDKHYRR